MTDLDDEYDDLVARLRATDDPEERRKLIRRLAALDRERNRDIYDGLAGDL